MINRLLTITLIISVLLFGSVEVWSAALIQFIVFTLGLIWVLRGEYRRYEVHGAPRLLLLIALTFIVYAAFQTVPLPSALFKLIAPLSSQIQSFYSFGTPDTMSISLNAYGTLYETIRCFAFFVVFAVSALSFTNRETLRETLKTLTIFGFSLAIFAILQKATWNNGIYWFRELSMGGSPFGPFVNRNHFAGFIGMLIPLGLGLSITRKEKEMKILFGFMTAIMAVSLFFSLSRGGIISFFAGIALFAALILQRDKGQRKVWIIVIFVIFVLSYIIYLGIDPVIERFYKTDVSNEQRLAVWAATCKGIRDFWPTGSGLGTFINVFPLYSPASISEVYDHAHNDYLEFFLETGLIGAILLLTFAATMFYAVKKASFRGRKGILLAAALSSGFTMVVHSIFDFNLHILSNLLMFASVLGMVAALSGTDDNEDQDKVPKEKKRDNTIREDTSWLMASRPESRRKGPAQRKGSSEDVPEDPETEINEDVPEDREGAKNAPWEGEKGT